MWRILSADVLEGEKWEPEGFSETSGIYMRKNYVKSQKKVRLFFIVTS
jgi:hypothetical protein